MFYLKVCCIKPKTFTCTKVLSGATRSIMITVLDEFRITIRQVNIMRQAIGPRCAERNLQLI